MELFEDPRPDDGPWSHGLKGISQQQRIPFQQKDGVDSANILNMPPEDVASFSVGILTNYSNQLENLSKEIKVEKTRLDEIDFKVGDMKQRVDSAIVTLNKICVPRGPLSK